MNHSYIVNKCSFVHQRQDTGSREITTVEKCENDTIYRVIKRLNSYNGTTLKSIEFMSEDKADKMFNILKVMNPDKCGRDGFVNDYDGFENDGK